MGLCQANMIFMILLILDRVSAGAVQMSLTQNANPPQFVSPWLGVKVPPWAKPPKNAKTEPD